MCVAAQGAISHRTQQYVARSVKVSVNPNAFVHEVRLASDVHQFTIEAIRHARVRLVAAEQQHTVLLALEGKPLGELEEPV